MPPHKFTRKEMKKDAFVSSTEKTLSFLQDNATAVGAALLVLVVLLVGGSYVRKSQEASRLEASYLLYLGQSLVSQGDYEVAIAPLEECIEKHGRSDYAKYARVGVVQALLGVGEAGSALARAEVYRQEVGDRHPAGRQLDLLHTHALADAGRFEEGAAALAELTGDDMPAAIYYDRSLLRARWLENAGRPLEALQVLDGLQKAIAAGELQVQGLDADLEQRLEVARALAR